MQVSRRITHMLNKLGAKGLIRALLRGGLMSRCLFDARDVRAKTLWDIADDAAARVGVANWINTWPAHPVNGFIASDRLQPWRSAIMRRERPKTDSLTFPHALADELQPLLVAPQQVPLELLGRYVSAPEGELAGMLDCEFDRRSLESEMRFALSSDLSASRVFEHCLDAFAPLDLAVVFFWAMDKVQHAGLKYAPMAADASVSDEERERFGNVVPESYGFIDRLLGRIMSRMGSDDTIFVMSDHGCVFEPKRGTYGHKRAQPPGVFIAYGREFRRGYELKDATIYDVAPTVLRVCGLRPAQDMPGQCLDACLTPEFLGENPPQPPVATYGSRKSDAGEAGAGETIDRS